MDFKRFKEIIKNGIEYEKEVSDTVNEFQKIVNININNNMIKLMKEIAKSLDLFMI